MALKQKIILSATVPLMSIVLLTHLFTLTSVSSAQICTVPGDFSTIQTAVDDSTCNTIQVGSGTFYENVVITRTVTIEGQGALSTIVDGNESSSVFTIKPRVPITTLPVVILTGLTIVNGSGYVSGGGINAVAAYVTLNNSVITENNVHGPTSEICKGGGMFVNGVILTINNSVITKNSANENECDFEYDDKSGGGIYISGGTAIINNSVVSNNTAQVAGGIFNYKGTVTINNSFVNDNTAEAAGGIFNYEDHNGTAYMIINNSIISGNHAVDGDYNGIIGGILNSGTMTISNSIVNDNVAYTSVGGIGNEGNLAIRNSTISNNDASNGDGGGLASLTIGTTTINNSTISGNSAANNGGNIFISRGVITSANSIIANSLSGGDCFGNINSLGYNLDSDNSCSLKATGDIINANPLLGPLQDNGGPATPNGVIPTHALLLGSPAIDQIPNGVHGCQANISTDQRGYIRAGGIGKGGVACDIGAFEFDAYGQIFIYLPIAVKP